MDNFHDISGVVRKLRARLKLSQEERAVLEAGHSLARLYLPPECRWPLVSRRESFSRPMDKAPKTLGEQLTVTVRAIAKANAEKLAGVIDIVDYSAARRGERRIASILGALDCTIALHERKRAAFSDLQQGRPRRLISAQIRVNDLDIDTREIENA
jgi:hypothetical protein